MKKEDDKRKMEELHQQKVSQMIKSVEGSAGLLHKITKPTAWRGEAQILKKKEEDARLLDRCERGKNGQSIGSVMRACGTLRTSLGKRRVRIGKSFEISTRENTGAGCDGCHS